jgi:perosamine synthetase
MQVPFFRPQITEHEIDEVVATLRSGWLTSGPRAQRFEREFADAVGGSYAVAVNSCTAALHLAVEALGLKPGQGVLVPTMTFAATAEVVRYLGAIPILVDCDPVTLNVDLIDAARRSSADYTDYTDDQKTKPEIVGIMPVHVGGLMMNPVATQEFATEQGIWIVEDAAHAFPAACRRKWSGSGGQGSEVSTGSGSDRVLPGDEQSEWHRCGEGTATVSCFSFYANKTITTGEGGMAVTDDEELARRMRVMSLHGLSQDAWERYSGGSSWDYRIIAPGFKYNLTDIAAAIGIHQLARAEAMRHERDAVARAYFERFAEVDEIELPPDDENRIHSWHLFPIKLRLECLTIDRNQFVEELKQAGVGCSVHWRPLHLHPYYQQTFNYKAEDFPVATAVWHRLISLPIFPGMRSDEIEHVIETVRTICRRSRK